MCKNYVAADYTSQRNHIPTKLKHSQALMYQSFFTTTVKNINVIQIFRDNKLMNQKNLSNSLQNGFTYRMLEKKKFRKNPKSSSTCM